MSVLKYDNLNIHDKKQLLLRVLGVRPERISQLQSGEIFLSDALSERIREVMNNPDDTTQCAIVCQNIRQEGASYETLEPDKYLEHINVLKSGGGRFADDIAPEEVHEESVDAISAYIAGIYPRPFVRMFTRSADLMLYLLVVNCFCRLILHFDPIANSYIFAGWAIFTYIVMLAVEPVLIHFFGTTPGKWLAGVRISDLHGEKLSWSAAYLRSFRILRFGYGFFIPFYSLFTMIRSFAECRIGHILPWDIGVSITKPEKNGAVRIALVFALMFAAYSLDSAANFVLERPRNKGALTEQEFFDNCAYIIKYNSVTFSEVPEYKVSTDKDGKVRSVSFTITLDEDKKPDYIYRSYNEMYVAFMAFAGAQKEFRPLQYHYGSTSRYLANSFTDFAFEHAGVRVTNDVDYSGYARNILSDYLYRLPDGSPSYSQTFTISLK